ncbi:MAG: methionine--tRNA ligase [Candidatus Omnitrophica bacterium]|nr:methionine--tRNA ligase [Candidatus Omnitrophota bacterium]
MRVYITTPIYYVNDEPHIGHCYTTILADVISRYYRLFGYEVRMQTGTDEHGQKVQQSAAKRGLSPQAQCDEYSKRFEAMWEKLEIHPDHHFIRTTAEFHKKAVQEFLRRLEKAKTPEGRDAIYEADYSGWYNVSEEMFISEDDVTEEGKASGRIVHLTEKNHFFRLSDYGEWLKTYIQDHPAFIQPTGRRNEVLGLIDQGLSDLCISRPKSRLSWGIEIPFAPDYVTYVWVDALVNYLSGIGWPEDPDWEKWWGSGVEALHLIGKDILKPHGVFWPCLLHAAGVPLPTTLLAHGWWTRGGQKESKTVTQALAAQLPVRHIRELIEEYGVDPIRYYLMREMTLGNDQDYSEELIVARINSDLANDLGNLLNRVTTLVRNHFEGKAPAPGTPDSGGEELLASVKACVEEIAPSEAGWGDPRTKVESIRGCVRMANQYVTDREPWKLLKEGKSAEAGQCLAAALWSLRVLAVLLHPILPRKMEALLAQIGCPAKKDDVVWDGRFDLPAPGTLIPGGEPLFPRIDWKAVEAKLAQSSKETRKEVEVPRMELISIEDFKKTDLRVAQVLAAERVPKADKLLKLQIRIGSEERQIIAGVAEFYAPEEIVGKQIIVVANLAPAKIRGIESRGMLLAAREGDRLRLLTLDGDGVGDGAKVG